MYISDLDVKQPISCLCSTKCIRPDEVPNFIIKGCFEIFAPLLSHIFNLSVLTGSFPHYGSRWLLYLFLRKATEFWLLIIDLSQF
jgi:hypothetical protein